MFGAVHLSLYDLLQGDSLAAHETLQRFGGVAVGIEGNRPFRAFPQVRGVRFPGRNPVDDCHDAPGGAVDADLAVRQA